jgi:hypothetical protein
MAAVELGDAREEGKPGELERWGSSELRVMTSKKTNLTAIIDSTLEIYSVRTCKHSKLVT